MKTFVRPDSARIHRRDSWKTSAYAFVPYETNFGELCGFADDVVAPGQGFGLHPHRDMEISTVVLRGAQRHTDSTGDVDVIGANAVQTMSAGTGIRHSEMNASLTEPVHGFQIWIYPKRLGTAPRHERFEYAPEAKQDRIVLALSPDGREGSARIGQDAFLSLARLGAGRTQSYAVHAEGNGTYVHCASGSVTIAGVRLGAGDAIGVYETDRFTIEPSADAELVFVEVPMERGIRA
jgi:redox-sensitive bicupin YhaK (pirin superfamily)